MFQLDVSLVNQFAALGSLLAYIGPGAGLGLGGAVLGLLAAVGTALLFVVLWPIRMLLRRNCEDAAVGGEDGQAGPSHSEAA